MQLQDHPTLLPLADAVSIAFPNQVPRAARDVSGDYDDDEDEDDFYDDEDDDERPKREEDEDLDEGDDEGDDLFDDDDEDGDEADDEDDDLDFVFERVTGLDLPEPAFAPLCAGGAPGASEGPENRSLGVSAGR